MLYKFHAKGGCTFWLELQRLWSNIPGVLRALLADVTSFAVEACIRKFLLSDLTTDDRVEAVKKLSQMCLV